MLRTVQPNEFVLVRKPDGKHYEEFCHEDDALALHALVMKARDGTLDGHVPVPKDRYSCRLYFPAKRIQVKLTKRIVKTIRR